MSIKEYIKELRNSETSYCNICGQEIRNLDHAILLTRTDRLIFDCIEHENRELLLVCDNCFENVIYEFTISHGIKHFCADTTFDNKILNLR